MSKQAEIEAKFWKALKSDRTAMLGLTGVDEAHSQPMTAQLNEKEGDSIWFFTSTEADLVRTMGQQHRAQLQFVSKGHELFATLDGNLVIDNDRETIEHLWNPFVAAWFEGGKDDPKLQLIRFDPEDGQVWLNEHSLLAGVKMLLGRDPKKDYKDKVAEVRLN